MDAYASVRARWLISLECWESSCNIIGRSPVSSSCLFTHQERMANRWEISLRYVGHGCLRCSSSNYVNPRLLNYVYYVSVTFDMGIKVNGHQDKRHCCPN